MLSERYAGPSLADALRYVVVAPSGSRGDGDASSGHCLEHLLSERQRTLGSILRFIDTEVRHRKQLSRRVSKEVLRQYLYVKSKLFVLDGFPLSGNRAWEMRRSALEKELDGLNKEQRTEQVACFRDIAVLTAEWRTWFKQYGEAVQRTGLVLGYRGERR